MYTTKNSLSSPKSTSPPSCRRVRTVHVAQLLLLLFLVIASSTTTTTCRGLSFAASPTTTTTETESFSRNDIHSSTHSHSLDQRHHRPCDSFSHEQSRSLCDQFRRMNRHKNHRPPPPPPPQEVIDPRYGVEKRLVPSGPNPLHN